MRTPLQALTWCVYCNSYIDIFNSWFSKVCWGKKNEILLEVVDLLEPGDAVDGKLICEPQLVGRKEPNVSRCFPPRMEV